MFLSTRKYISTMLHKNTHIVNLVLKSGEYRTGVLQYDHLLEEFSWKIDENCTLSDVVLISEFIEFDYVKINNEYVILKNNELYDVDMSIHINTEEHAQYITTCLSNYHNSYTMTLYQGDRICNNKTQNEYIVLNVCKPPTEFDDGTIDIIDCSTGKVDDVLYNGWQNTFTRII